MARNTDQTARLIRAAAEWFFRQPPRVKAVVLALVLAAGAVAVAAWAARTRGPGGPGPAGAAVPPGTVVFMFWNVEELFDDQDDRRNSVDDPVDNWFATDATARRHKYDHLSDAILKLTGGRGPDLLACVEVESVRAADLLREALNAKLPAGVPRYEHVAMRELRKNAGRYIAPCLISRLPVDDARTRLHGGGMLRILETHVVANGHDLTVVVSHWTSQRSQKDGGHGEEGREKYAAAVYGVYERVMGQDPDADFLVCGDFNATPDADAVARGLHLTADRAAVVPTRTEPRLFGLLSGKPAAEYGTHYYRQPLIYDQVGVSPGLLDDRGWGCDPASVRVPTDGLTRGRTRQPWRFGKPGENPQGRGYSDHFPVVVNLQLGPAGP